MKGLMVGMTPMKAMQMAIRVAHVVVLVACLNLIRTVLNNNYSASLYERGPKGETKVLSFKQSSNPVEHKTMIGYGHTIGNTRHIFIKRRLIAFGVSLWGGIIGSHHNDRGAEVGGTVSLSF